MAATSPRPAPTYKPQTQPAKVPPAPVGVQKVQSLLLTYKTAIEQALPKHMTTDRMMRLCLTELRRVPKLQECDAMSFVGSVIQAAQLGLEPGAALGQCYLIPRKAECTLLIGYRGMVSLARRSGEILSISARVVYEGDEFHAQYGTDEKIVHIPAFTSSTMTHVYAVAQLKGGGTQFDIMSMAEVDYVRKTYASDKSDAWANSYDEMAKKTVVRRLFKLLPVSVELADALAHEESDQRNHEILDVNHTPVEAKPDVERIVSQWEDPAETKAAADRVVAEKMLDNQLSHLEQKNVDPAPILAVFGGKPAKDWLPTVDTAAIYVAMETLKALAPK